LKTPVLGSVYVLPPKAAERMSKGDPPGCWVPPELLSKIQEEAKAEDKGLAARLERAAKMAAISKGLGYAGAYIGGTYNPEHIRGIIRRAEELAPRWEELAEEISYGHKGGFFLYDSPAPAAKPREFTQKLFDIVEPANTPKPLRKVLTGVMSWIDKHPAAADALEKAELAFKKPVFGCQACGNCVLGLMEYVCPMTCPKNLRNGPCGGTSNGQCEVIPEQACIWVEVYQRAKSADRVDELKVYIPPRDRALQGTSSYVNYFLNRDSRPDHPKQLIAIDTVKPAASHESAEAVVKK
jgi:methylenetetrahydrofolate reductase (NADPH)